MKELVALSTALQALRAAAEAAYAALPNDDTLTVQAQSDKALQTCSELEATIAVKERALAVLHGLNNKLTGALSLTMLAREDLPKGSNDDAPLALVEQRAREAADAARVLSTALKAMS